MRLTSIWALVCIHTTIGACSPKSEIPFPNTFPLLWNFFSEFFETEQELKGFGWVLKWTWIVTVRLDGAECYDAFSRTHPVSVKWATRNGYIRARISVNAIMISLCQQWGSAFSLILKTNEKARHAMINEREQKQEMIFRARLVAFSTFLFYFTANILFLFCLLWLLLWRAIHLSNTQ